MVVIRVKELDDFKQLAKDNNVKVFYTIEEDVITLFLDLENIYMLQLRIVNEEELDLFLENNFDEVMEMQEVEL